MPTAYRGFRSKCLRICAALVAALCVATVVAPAFAGSEPVARRYPPGAIHSVQQAKQALADVSAERAAVESRFSAEQSNCYSKFFASSCMDQAKERRRAALEQLRAVEVNANLFLRRDRAEQRDREVERKRAQDEAERAERLQRAAQTAAKKDRTESRAANAVSTPQGNPDPDRVARHEQKLRQMQAEEAANAGQRAANVAAYQRKVREAQERQQEVAQKKAEKERERTNKAAVPQPLAQ